MRDRIGRDGQPLDFAEEPMKYQKPDFIGSPFQVAGNDDNKLKIEKVLNGVIIEYPNDNGGDFPRKEVIEFEDDKQGGVRQLLYNLIEWLGNEGGKYDKEQIEINIVHGRGYECKDKKCEICGNECSIGRKK